MSNQYYTIKWRTTINQLMEALQLELEPLEKNEQMGNMKYKRNDSEWFMYYGKLYIFYVDAYNALEDCYDQIVHPQKRVLLKNMVENCMLRIIQIKEALIYYSTTGNVIRSDFVNLDPVLIQEKRIMSSLEVKLPRFFMEGNIKRREYRNQLMDKLLMQFHDTNLPEEEVIDDKLILINIDDSVRWIQKIERGRQGIERAYLAKHLRRQDAKKQDKQRRLQEGTEIPEETERDEAILVIQKYYRGFKAREEIWHRRKQEMQFLGFELNKTEMDKEKLLELEKREMQKKAQKEHLKDYKSALQDAKESLLQNWTDDIKDNMLKDRRDWYWSEVAKAEGKFVPPGVKDFYKKDEIRPPLNDEEQEQMDLIEKERKAKKKDKGKKKKKKKKTDDDEDQREEQGPSKAVLDIQNEIEEFTTQWDSKDEHQNFYQTHDQSLLNDEIATEAESQVRRMVDQMIDIELVNLRVALKAKKYKYPKEGGKDQVDLGDKKPPKKKKVSRVPQPIYDEKEDTIEFRMRSDKVDTKKKSKKKKKKFPGDKLTNKKDPRDMLAELIEAGIAKKLQPAKIEDLVGEAYPLRYKQELLQEKVADPSMFDLRQVVTQFVGMPLGSSYVKDNTKESNYYLFYGPPGSGKTHVVRALQTQCNAIVIDLSPSNIENKYTDKPEYMLSLSFKVAGCFQPAIIYIDEIEKIFKGKKKKKKKTPNSPPEVNYTKLRKFLLKYNKFYTEKQPENVAIIGCTNSPWDANKKQLKQFFKKKIYFPTPNYATRLKLFTQLLAQKNVTLHPSFPITSLAHVTEGFSAGNIKVALDNVLTVRRIALSNEIPYRLNEFLQPLSQQQSTFLSVYLKFRDLHNELSGNKARIEKRDNPNGDEAKGAKKKKKKKK